MAKKKLTRPQAAEARAADRRENKPKPTPKQKKRRFDQARKELDEALAKRGRIRRS